MSQIRAWSTIKFEVARSNEDLACWLAIQAGAQGCEVEAGLKNDLLIKAYFDPEKLDGSKLALHLEEYGLGEAIASLQQEELQEQDWLSRFKAGFEAFNVGQKLRIKPVWEENGTGEEDAGRITIVIDPGMAFGTGLHATTQFCLERLVDGGNFKRIADIGTGSGILAIAAKLLDKNCTVIGVDIDGNAIANAYRNIEINGLADQITLLEGGPEVLSGKFDCLLSNLTCEDIVALMPTYVELIQPGGKIICAGILAEKQNMLNAGAHQNNFAVIRADKSGEWLGVVLEAPRNCQINITGILPGNRYQV
jgi:ribosomal protein L11 methyltransferase